MTKAQLFAMGTQRELLSTQLMYYRTVNAKTGRSGPIPMGGLITLAFVSGDGDDRLLRWITHSPEGELCTLTAAKIVFYEGDLDGIVLFKYRLHDAALVHWKEEFKATGTTPMTVTITISAAIQEIKGVTWVKPWRESEVLSEEIATHEEGVQRGVSDNRGKEKDGSVLQGVVLEVAKLSSRILNTTTKQLQAKFKHAVDFGVTGNWNKAAAGKFNSAINQYINSAGVKTINGAYRGQSVIHHVNPNTGLNVISSPSGQFISGWKLNPVQLQNVLKHGGL